MKTFIPSHLRRALEGNSSCADEGGKRAEMINKNTSINELRQTGLISVRTFNNLIGAKVNTLGVLCERYPTPGSMLRISNFGRKCLMEIETVLAKMRENGPATVEVREMRREDLEPIVNEIKSQAFGQTNLRYLLNPKVDITEVYPDLDSLWFEVMQGVLPVKAGMQKEQNDEIRRYCKDFIVTMERLLAERGLTATKLYKQVAQLEKKYETSVEDYLLRESAQHFLSPVCQEFLQEEYDRLLSTYNVRTQNFAKKNLPTFETVIPFFGKSVEEYRTLCPLQHLDKTLEELQKFGAEFEKIFYETTQLEDGEIAKRRIQRLFPFLDSEQRAFVFKFHKEKGYFPFFFLMWNYAKTSTLKSNQIICAAYGVGGENEIRSYDEVARMFKMTAEGVRQNVLRGLKCDDSALTAHVTLAPYKEALPVSFLYEKAYHYEQMQEEEYLDFNFPFFAKLLSDFSENWKSIFIGDNLFLIDSDVIMDGIEKIEDKVRELKQMVVGRDTYVSMDEFVFDGKSVNRQTHDFITCLLKKFYKIEVDERNVVKVKQNFAPSPGTGGYGMARVSQTSGQSTYDYQKAYLARRRGRPRKKLERERKG